MLAIAPALAKACIVTVAIDLPLHGLPPTSPLYSGIERTFLLDATGKGPAMAGYTSAAPSGTHFINLASLITSRDNLRQGAADIITLARSIPSMTANTVAPFSVDATKIYFIGHSLGGIVGGTMLGINGSGTNDVKAATLAMPGGGIAKLLDASVNFSPVISGGLHTFGIDKGTDLYETFMRFAQTLADSGDPINYAVAAKAKHPIHMIEVVGGGASTAASPPSATVPSDQVVPNNALAGTLVTIPGYLSGTDPLFRIMGLTAATSTLTFTSGSPSPTPAGSGTLVKFAQGNHGSILSPAADSSSTAAINFAVTCEMQRETVSFLASGGLTLALGSCPAIP